MKRKWLAGALAAVSAGAGVTAWALSVDDRKSSAPVPATVAADIGAVTAAVAATGTVQPAVTRTLSFAVDGTVETINVRAGSVVRKGATLASVDDTDAADAVGAAKASLTEAETLLNAAKAAAATTAASVSSTAASGAAAGGGNGTGTSTSAGTVTGTATGLIGTATGTATRTTGTATRTGGTGTGTGTDAILAAQKQVNQARFTLKEAQNALAGATIIAPIAGTVMAVAGTVGSDVARGATFITLADTFDMRVSASFPEADAGSLAAGQTAAVTLADRVGERFPATVIQMDPVGVADGTLVTYGVVLNFTEQPSGLLTGQSAAVEVTTGSVAKTLRVPSTAVHDVAPGKGTVQVSSGGVITARRVFVGLRGGQYTQITSGLVEGELVIRSW